MTDVKLSQHQKEALSEILGALRFSTRPKGILWQTRRSLVRLGLVDSFGTLTDIGYEKAKQIRDTDPFGDVWVRRPRY